MIDSPLWLLALLGPRLVASLAQVVRPTPYTKATRTALFAFEVAILVCILITLPPHSPFWGHADLLWSLMAGQIGLLGFTLVTVPVLSWQHRRRPLTTSSLPLDWPMVGNLLLASFNEELLLRGVLLFGLWENLGGAATCALCIVADLWMHLYQGRRLVWYHLVAAVASIGLALGWGIVAAINFHFVHNLRVLFELWRQQRTGPA